MRGYAALLENEMDELIDPHGPVQDCDCRECACHERNRLRAALDDVAMALKICAWALRRGTSPALGERALALLKRLGLLGSPLREQTCGSNETLPAPACDRAEWARDLPAGAMLD